MLHPFQQRLNFLRRSSLQQSMSVVGFVAGLLLLAGAPLVAQGLPEALAGGDQEQAESTLPSRADIEAQLEAWNAELADLQPNEAEPLSADAVAMANEAGSVLEMQLDAARRSLEIERELARHEELAAQGPSALVETEPPYGFAALDGVLDRRDALEKELELARDELESARLGLDEAEERSQEELPAIAVTSEQWSVRVAHARRVLAQMRLDNARRLETLAEQRLLLARQAVPRVEERFVPDAEELQRKLDDIEDRRLRLEDGRSSLVREVEVADQRWREVQSRSTSTAALAAEVEARRWALDATDDRLKLLDAQLERLRLETRLWNRRFEIAGVGDLPSSLRVVNQSLADIGRTFEAQARQRTKKLEELRANRRSLEEAADDEAQRERWRQQSIQGIGEAIADFDNDRARLARLLELLERARSSIDHNRWRPRQLMQSALDAARQAWQLNLTSVDDRPITLGKALTALLLIFLGWLFSKRLSTSLGGVLQRRLAVGSGAAAALQNLAFYLLLVIFFLWAFRLVGIPLTVFTVLGGVVAIGVGFGSQNIVNNFISGLILLIERPIKVGDLIDVDGVLGSVERIGLRATRVRAGDNTHVIVPNSSFLEKNVLNWTVSDDLVRVEVDVGVAYGSDTKKVKALIEQALDEEPKVLKRPAWDVLFLEFGDNSLAFRAYFWTRVEGFLDKIRTASAVRFRIDSLFNDAGIVISFPQRDVHLDTVTPLQVQLVGAAPRDESGEGAHGAERVDDA